MLFCSTILSESQVFRHTAIRLKVRTSLENQQAQDMAIIVSAVIGELIGSSTCEPPYARCLMKNETSCCCR